MKTIDKNMQVFLNQLAKELFEVQKKKNALFVKLSKEVGCENLEAAAVQFDIDCEDAAVHDATLKDWENNLHDAVLGVYRNWELERLEELANKTAKEIAKIKSQF